MRKHLHELETAGIILLLIGTIIGHTVGMMQGAWPCGIGLLLFVFVTVFKACHWNEYERENKRNIMIMLGAILFILLTFFIRK